MSDCYLIKSGKQFALSFSSDVTEDIQATNICLKALNELMPCVQPISVEFRGCLKSLKDGKKTLSVYAVNR